MLARAREYYAGKNVNELVEGRNAFGKLAIDATFSNLKSILVYI